VASRSVCVRIWWRMAAAPSWCPEPGLGPFDVSMDNRQNA
jgi:hypothetical protein